MQQNLLETIFEASFPFLEGAQRWFGAASMDSQGQKGLPFGRAGSAWFVRGGFGETFATVL